MHADSHTYCLCEQVLVNCGKNSWHEPEEADFRVVSMGAHICLRLPMDLTAVRIGRLLELSNQFHRLTQWVCIQTMPNQAHDAF